MYVVKFWLTSHRSRGFASHGMNSVRSNKRAAMFLRSKYACVPHKNFFFAVATVGVRGVMSCSTHGICSRYNSSPAAGGLSELRRWYHPIKPAINQ